MKKLLLSLGAICLLFSSAFAQEEMQEVWRTDLDHKFDESGFNHKGGYSYSTDKKKITVVSNSDGKIIWSGAFKEISPNLRKIDDLVPLWDAECLFLFDRKMGKDAVAVIDVKTGKLLWETSKYQNLTEENIIYIRELGTFAISLKESLVMVNARTGEEIWETSKFRGVVGAYVYMNDDHLVMLNYKPTALGNLFAGMKNQIVKINTKNGDIVWDQTYRGQVERKAITREAIVNLDVQEGKVFLLLNGIQVYDYNTGVINWAAAFDETPRVIGEPAGAVRFGVYGAVAEPVVDGNDVYVLDMQNKRSQYVKKYDLNSGKLLWTSPEIKGAKAIPNMFLVDDKIVLQIGGAVEAQAYIRKQVRNPDGSYSWVTETRIWYPNVKPTGVQCFSAKDGASMWDSERFKKGITNIFPFQKNIIVCSGKELYSLELATGKENYGVALSADGIGLAEKILDYKDKVLIVGAKGVSSHLKENGKFVASSKYKNSTFAGEAGNVIKLETANKDLATFNKEDCSHKQYNARNGASSYISDDGLYVIVFEKKEVARLKAQ